ncbi:hypothetical protein HNP46_000448 [Pseudomonas nitritireducens]|uniref:MarR family transcriptional regulator n=1 Tax=Pseudomonas nitroreducens TaxID=46680 RepID=A0A7W7NZW0_PSENT|nr:hypothetical protein [Pseudomonas nitritireducens]MBB4861637.1 hypothetical protein [Pseudomonas nitritireducens]
MSFSKRELKDYLETTLGFPATVVGAGKLNVPPLIKNQYGLLEIEITPPGLPAIKLLGLVGKGEKYPGAVNLRKHINLTAKATDNVILYVSDSIDQADRRSMIDHQINFIRPGWQFHVPEIGISLREAFRKRRKLDVESLTLSPATQSMLIRNMIEGWDESDRFTSNGFMGNAKFSRVTLSKAIAELESANLIEHVNDSVINKVYRFTCPRNRMLQKAMPFLRNPVRRSVVIDEVPTDYVKAYLAGESALARYSLLAEPALPVFAMTNTAYKAMMDDNFILETGNDRAKAVVEIWSYKPFTTDSQTVDEVSLFLTLKDHPDERVQIALDELKEKHPWMKYED